MRGQDETADWEDLLATLVGYPAESLHAMLETRGDGDEDVCYEVWRQGRKLRVEKDGVPEYISDGEQSWVFPQPDQAGGDLGIPVRRQGGTGRYVGGAQHLCAPRPADDWQGSDFTRPEITVAAEVFQGRDCWTVQLKAPSGKTGPLRIWVDRDSGYQLGQVNESPQAEGHGQWFVSPEIGGELDDALFLWDGPTVAPEERRQRAAGRPKPSEESRMRWFRENVLDTRLTASATLDLVPDQMREQDDEVVGGKPGVFRFSRTTAAGDPPEVPQGAGHDRGTPGVDVAWRAGGHDWDVTVLCPAVIVDDALRAEVRRRFSRRDVEGRRRQMDWEELRNRLLSERRTTIHACVAWDDGDVPAMSFMGSHYRWGPGPRCMASDDDGEPRPAVLEFWRQGRKVRVEVSGRPVYITDGVQVWDFRGDAARPVVLTARTVSFARALDYSGAAQWLVRRPPAGRWIDDDVRPETPVDEDVLEGRSTWTFVIGETRVWVDTVSLHVLALQSVGSTYREKTVAPDIGVPLDDDLFTWGGPTTSPRDHRKSREAERERKKRQRIAGIRRWFVENVVEDDSDLEALPVTVDLTPTSVPRVSEETGEFVARGDDMELSRHIPGSDFRYEEDRAAHRWSALGYDWQLILWAEVVLGRAGIEEVWDQLHPGAEVTSYRPPGQ
ncbi:hypothetical protein [Corynebacterium kalidii]